MTGKQIINQFLKKKSLSYLIGTLLIFVSTVLTSFVPKIIGIIMDGLTDGSGILFIRKYIFYMIGIAFLIFISRFTWRYLLIGNCRYLEVFLREKLFSHFQTLPMSFFTERKTGDLIAHAINDVQAVRYAFGFGIVGFLDGVLVNTASIYFMAKTIDPILTIMALAPIPVLTVFLFKIRKHIRARFEKVQEAYALIADKVQENIMGIRVVKSFAQEDNEIKDFIKHSQKRVDAQMELTKVSAAIGPIAQICFAVSFGCFIIFGSQLVVEGKISVGDYVAFNSYMLAIMGPIVRISKIVEVCQKGIASFKRLDTIFKTKGDIEENEDMAKYQSSIKTIDMVRLNFSYPGTKKQILKNINLKIREGETIGIVGRTGSGKTTLVNLLLKLYPIERGQLFINGRDVNDVPSEYIREKIGCVPQDNFMFSTTIRNNIEFFKSVYSDFELEQAVKASVVYDNILSFPNGFNTVVGERGVTLSGGQKQTIPIERPLIKNPSVLILDDSLSAVDTETEMTILKNIKEVLNNKTGIIISNRVSALRHADLIIYMENGKIVERGTYEELIAKPKGKLAQLEKSQNNSEVKSVS